MLFLNSHSTSFTRRLYRSLGIFLGIFLLFVMSGLFTQNVFAGSTVLPATLLLSASVSESPAGIKLVWSADPSAQKYDVYRKTKNATVWGDAIATVMSPTTTYIDTTALAGSIFEYRVVKTFVGGGDDRAYVLAGNQAPLVDNRGQLILVVDTTHATDLAFELSRLRDDLEGDGWSVTRIDVNRSDTPASVRSRIAQSANLGNNPHVFLFGRVPVVYSGISAADGHDDHIGAWPTDAYYGDIDGQWTDTGSSETYCSDQYFERPCPVVFNRIANFPGDGKFDQNVIPSKVELAVGRVDFANMPAFLPKSEKDLLRQYLNKDHLFRVGGMNVRTEKAGRGMTFDQWNFFHEQDTWKDFVAFFGQNKFVSDGNIFTSATAEPYLWLRVAGGGYSTGIYGGPNVSNIVQHGGQAVFNQMFGSYFGDWDFDNNLMRAFIADKSYGLTSVWAGFYGWKFHRMGLGETVGDSARLSQNIDPNQSYAAPYSWSGNSYSARRAPMALLGDPTLRQNIVLPPTDVTFVGQSGSIKIAWTASADTNIVGYHVYKATPDTSAFVRITPTTPITTTNFVDSAVSSGRSRYMVKAVKLENTGSGSYYNSSQGVIRNVSVLAFANPVSVQDVTMTTGGCALDACPTTGPAKPAFSNISIFPADPAVITVKQGEVFSTKFHYRGGPTETINWDPFTFLVSEDGAIVVGANDFGYPNLKFSQYPTGWTGGDVYETFSFKTPTNGLPPGKYRLFSGLYSGADRLTMNNPANLPEGQDSYLSYIKSYEVARVTVEQGVDTIAPGISNITINGTIPNGVFQLPAGTTNMSVSFVTNESATCKYATVSGTAYSAMTASFTATNAGKTHSAVVTGLTNGSYRNIYIRCVDASGNMNTTDKWVTASVQSPAVDTSTTNTFTISAPNNTEVRIERGSFGIISLPIQKTGSAVARPVTIRMLSTLGSGLSYVFINPETCTPNSVTSSCTFTLRINTTNETPLVTNTPITFGFFDGEAPLTSVTVSMSVVVPASQVLPTQPEPVPTTARSADVIFDSVSDTKSYQTISFDAISNKLATDSFDLIPLATTTSGLRINMTVVSGDATIVTLGGMNPYGKRISFGGPGTVTVRATQVGNTNYYAATPVERTFTVTKAPISSITLSGLTGNTYDTTIKRATAVTDPIGKTVDITYRQTSSWLFGLVTTVSNTTSAPTEAGSYEVTATVIDSKYSGTQTGTLVIAKAPQTITTNFPTANLEKNIGDYIDLSAVSPATGSVVYTISGTGSATLSASNRLAFTGEGVVTVTVSHPGDANYLPSVNSPVNQVTFTVVKSGATITLGGLTQVFTNTPREVTTTTNPANMPVVVTYNNSTTAPTAVGTYQVVATVNSATYAGQVINTLTIQKANQAITFNTIASEKKVGESFDLSASSDSGLPVTFTVSGPATLGQNGKTVTITGVGLVTVVASQNGSGNYNPASSITQSFSTIKNNAVITFDQNTLTQTYTGSTKSVTATTNPAGKNVIFTYAPVAPWWTLGGLFGNNASAPVHVGSYTVTATINDAGYSGTQTATLVIGKASHTLTTNFSGTVINKLVHDTVTLSATSPASGLVNLSILGPATLSGDTLTFTDAGTVTVTASHGGDNNYLPAPNVVATFAVSKSSAVIRVSNASYVYDGSTKSPVIVTEPANLPYTLTYANPSATRIEVGTYPFTATITSTTHSGTVSGTLEITKLSQTIIFNNVASGKKVGDVFDLEVTSSSQNPVQLTLSTVPAGIASLSEKTLTITGAGTITITASQPATTNHTRALDVVKTIEIPKTVADIEINYPDTVYAGQAKKVTYTTNPSVPASSVAVFYNGSSVEPINAGTYTVAVSIEHPDYSGSKTGTFTITKANQSVVFNPVTARKTNEKEILSVSGAQGAVSYSVVSVNAEINQVTNEITYTAPGLVRVRATVAETANYAGTSVEKEITVSAPVVLGGSLIIVNDRTDAIVTSPRQSKIKWNTNLPGTSEVVYAQTSLWANVASRARQQITDGTRTAHEVVLQNLRPRTEYTYKAISKDAQGKEAVNDPVFTTADEPHTITISTSGTGTGSLVLFPVGTSCGTNCQQYPYDTQVTVTATPASGSTFSSMSGCTVVNTNTCVVMLTSDYTIGAVFALAPISPTPVPAPSATTLPPDVIVDGTVSEPGQLPPVTADFGGWAWSSNIGWISFSSTNAGASGTEYQVILDNATREFSGYAWSSNIGWITFNKHELVGCPSGECVAKMTGDALSGWARACSSMFQFMCGLNALTTAETSALGGWTGWISLDSKAGESITYGPKVVDNVLTGFAWGGDVFGWISFEWLNQLKNPTKPNVTVTLSDTVVPVNGKTNVTWEVSGADTCTASGGWTGNKSKTGGTEESGTILANTTFFLTCAGPGGETTGSASVGVSTTPLSPTVSIEAVPTTVSSGSTVALRWKVDNATSCTASNNAGNSQWQGGAEVPIDALTYASRSISSLTQSTQFVLTCSSGTLSASDSVTVVVTNNPISPTVSLVSPLANAQFKQNTVVTLTAIANDTDGRVTNVSFYDNGILIPGAMVTTPTQTTMAGGTYMYSYTPSVGAHAFKAVVTDDDNLSTDSATVSISIEPLRPPTVSLNTNKTQLTVGESITLTATASDTDGIINRVEFYDNGILISTDVFGPSYAYAYTPTGTGNHQFKARAIDNDNLGADSADVNIGVSGGTAILYPPTVSLTAPVNNTEFVQNTTITLTATASDTDGSISRVDFYDGATLIGTDNTAPYSFAYTNPSVGTHQLKARAIDNSALSSDSADVSVTVNAFQAPSISLTSPLPNDQVTLGGSVQLRASAIKGDGTILSVKFYDGVTVIKTDTTTVYPNPYLYTYTPTTAGTHQLSAQITDSNGFVINSGTVSIVVSSVALPPEVTLDINPETITTGQSVVLSWTVSGATSCSPSSSPVNTQWNGAGTKAIPAPGATLTQTVTGISANTQFTLTCTGAGGTDTTSANVLVTSAPIAPNINLTVTIPDGREFGIVGQTVLLSWEAFNAENGCVASGAWTGARSTLGLNVESPTLSAPEATFKITCTGLGGTRSQEKTIPVRGRSALPESDPCLNGQVCLRPPLPPAPVAAEDIDVYVSVPTRVINQYGRGFKGGLVTVNSNEAYTVEWSTASELSTGWTCAPTANGAGITNSFLTRGDVGTLNFKSGTLSGISTPNTGTTPLIKTYSITCTKNAGITGLFTSLLQLASVGSIAQATTLEVVSDSISIQVSPEGTPAVSNPINNVGNCLYLNTPTPTEVVKNTSVPFYRKNLVGPGQSCSNEKQAFRCRAGEVDKNGAVVSPYLDPSPAEYKDYKYTTCQSSFVEEF